MFSLCPAHRLQTRVSWSLRGDCGKPEAPRRPSVFLRSGLILPLIILDIGGEEAVLRTPARFWILPAGG